MSKVRINDLARELEVKSRPILDALEAIGVTGKTHSSSIEADQAERVREYFSGNRGSTASKPAAETKPKFDLSKVSKPGDALKAILERKQAEAAAKAAPPPRPAAVVAPPAPGHVAAVSARPVAAVAAAPASSIAAAAPTAPAPRRIVPLPRQGANIVAPPQAPAIASKPPVGPVIARPPAGAPASAHPPVHERPAVAAAP
ncbi:MAG TPA: translation initiation factor IF-2 N-terminal domain-containing protein, partial [Edaphobacter sp.]